MAASSSFLRRLVLPLLVLVALISIIIFYYQPEANWSLPLALMLFVLIVAADYTAVKVPSIGKISGSIVVIVIASVVLGPLPAMGLGAASCLAIWLKNKNHYQTLIIDTLVYLAFPLAAGLFFQIIIEETGFQSEQAGFYIIVFYAFILALMINFVLVALDASSLDGESLQYKFQRSFLPLLPSESLAALLTAGSVAIYYQIGPAALILIALILIVIQYLVGALLTSQQRAEALEKRSKELATFQIGLLSALVRTLDLRDQMTARHSAAVARYSRATALAMGLNEKEADLAHTAGLLHDIGKFILPDKILKATEKLNDEDWQLIRQHPQQGAKVVSAIEGYGPVADIIRAHHERIDGKGYPRGLQGKDIPLLSRIISVADTYDVLTARDSYQQPITSQEALELMSEKLAGYQLDEAIVEIFKMIVEEQELSFQHGQAADFDAELALDRRIIEMLENAND